MRKRRLPAALAALFLVYVPLALWARSSYVAPAPKGRVNVPLLRPFGREQESAFKARFERNILPMDMPPLRGLGDDPNIKGDARSPVMVYEDDRPLGPGHSNFADIAKLGMGRFAHWRGNIFFSASDNTNPNTNGRRYWVVVP